ncbi:MAG: hypothetical protein F4Y27_02735 [Acidimicrobiaceae bacterium]|nr:hypothetical protein [Acidimicrobiaceae bacterium]MXW61182.1 hypothetical protein [Acidimicrobiaceae bacterium]MXW74490.1 hypothetical protein [Acidimicrobiaceae bacterium]MYA73581.1 hypothetical protein [Acidimicrobiaceae bacterium]MYC41516.1 hypothetical protein [Acidimicrobiaceae bacterium]
MLRKQQIIFAILVATGIALIASAALVNSGNQPDTALSVSGVEGLIPERDDEVLQQQRVGIDLEPEYRLVEMTISANARCERPVEVTQYVRRVEGLQQFIYQPGPGLPVEALAPDQNCVSVTIEKISLPGRYSEIDWVFTVN